MHGNICYTHQVHDVDKQMSFCSSVPSFLCLSAVCNAYSCWWRVLIVSATLTCYVVIIIIRRLITRAMSEYMATSESNVVRGVPLTVKHIVECSNLQNVRNKYYSVSSLRDLSVSVDSHNIIDFIKETHFTTVCNISYFTFLDYLFSLDLHISIFIFKISTPC